MAKKNTEGESAKKAAELISAENETKTKKGAGKPEPINMTPEEMAAYQKKRKTVMSLISYGIGVLAVLLAVLFVAQWAGSEAWFTFVPRFLMGVFSWPATLVPILLIYCAYFLPKILKSKKHIWNLILAVALLVDITVMFGLILDGDQTDFGIGAVYVSGKEGNGGGVVGTYISRLLVLAFSTVGAWVIVIAAGLAEAVFLVGLSLEDAGKFAKKVFLSFWEKIKSLFKGKKSGKKTEKKKADKNEPEEDDDEEFIPPERPKEGTKFYHKPLTDNNPYAEDADADEVPGAEAGNGKRMREPSTGNKKKSEFDDEDDDTDADGIAALPTPVVVARPDAPKGWGEGAQSEVRSKNEELPKVRQKPQAVKGSIDLDDIFSNEKKDKKEEKPFGMSVDIFDDGEESENEDESGASAGNETGIPAKRTQLISAVEDGEEEVKKEYLFPPMSLLTAIPAKQTDVSEELNTNATRLVETLRSFKVRTKVVNVSRGPTITRYELQPEEGVRVRAISNLVDDIALNLATSGVRIEAPIPGKAAVGVEVPNKDRETVYLRSLLDDRRFEQSTAKLTAAIGVDVGGDPIYFDLAKMPHLLIAGTTGSGKSVCLNCLILSMLYKATPDEVKMIMIDPKKVEFNVYNGLPHLIIPVVSNAKKAAGALSWAVSEMERRYELIEMVGVRDIKNYNKVTANDPEKEYMPQLVIIIDELADLMMTAPGEVEESICRIAQKGRACGMHLIIGTQRPSVDVITGLIKANVPSRIAFTVSSQVDSRTIIDIAGAEKLIGRGDMLFAPIGSMKPARLQGPFVSDEEVEAVTQFIIDHSAEAVYDDKVMKDIEKEAELCGNKGKKSAGAEADLSDDDGESDPMLKAAIDLAVESGKISTSLIQRRLSLGYGRAAKLIDEMEKRGIVSPPEGQKPRSVLISRSEWDEMCMRAEDN